MINACGKNDFIQGFQRAKKFASRICPALVSVAVIKTHLYRALTMVYDLDTVVCFRRFCHVRPSVHMEQLGSHWTEFDYI